MRMSEAMLLGLGEIRFTNEVWLSADEASGKCEGCLLGAAMYAKGIRGMQLEDSIADLIYKLWPWTKRYNFADFACPFCNMRGWNSDHDNWGVQTALTHLASHYERKEITAEQA